MRLSNDFITNLIVEKDPIPIIWDYLTNQIWVADTSDLTAYYAKEAEVATLEKILNRVYGELYTEILPRACYTKDKELPMKENIPIIIMDGMSIREASLFCKKLREEGFSVEMTYSFSAAPSDTLFFKEKIGFSQLLKTHAVAEIRDKDKIRLTGREKIVWSRFPDAYVEKIRVGKTKLSSIEEMYNKSEEVLLRILDSFEGDQFLIMSDHGYISLEAQYTFNAGTSQKRMLKSIFGSSRYCSMGGVKAEHLVRSGFIVEFNGFYIIRGRYTWPTGGKFTVFTHGSISLMECITPKLHISRDSYD